MFFLLCPWVSLLSSSFAHGHLHDGAPPARSFARPRSAGLSKLGPDRRPVVPLDHFQFLQSCTPGWAHDGARSKSHSACAHSQVPQFSLSWPAPATRARSDGLGAAALGFFVAPAILNFCSHGPAELSLAPFGALSGWPPGPGAEPGCCKKICLNLTRRSFASPLPSFGKISVENHKNLVLSVRVARATHIGSFSAWPLSVSLATLKGRISRSLSTWLLRARPLSTSGNFATVGGLIPNFALSWANVGAEYLFDLVVTTSSATGVRALGPATTLTPPPGLARDFTRDPASWFSKKFAALKGVDYTLLRVGFDMLFSMPAM